MLRNIHITDNHASETTLCNRGTAALLTTQPDKDDHVGVRDTARVCRRCEGALENRGGTVFRFELSLLYETTGR
jgi:hypothetical protein